MNGPTMSSVESCGMVRYHFCGPREWVCKQIADLRAQYRPAGYGTFGWCAETPLPDDPPGYVRGVAARAVSCD